MGRSKKLKAERKSAREQADTAKAKRHYFIKWAVITVALIVAIIALVPAGFGEKLLNKTGVTKEESMQGTQKVTLQTDKGTVKLELYPDKAPKTVEHITELVKKGFYDGITFHRVVPGFVVQGGDPTGTGSGGSGQNIPFEENDLKHEKGVLAMARSQSKDSADSQFYITLAPQPSLDGEYVVFGKVVEGMDVVEQIAQGDKMTKVTLEQ